MKIINHMIISSLEFSWVDADLPSFIFLKNYLRTILGNENEY